MKGNEWRFGRSLLWAVGLSLLALAWGGCGDWKVYRLRDKDLIVLRNMGRVYPHYAREFELSFNSIVETKAALTKLAVDSKFESQVENLYEKLDQVNAHVKAIVVTAYSGYVTGMSAAEDRSERDQRKGEFDETVREVNEMALDLRQLNAQIGVAKVRTSATGEWEKLFEMGEALKRKADLILYGVEARKRRLAP